MEYHFEPIELLAAGTNTGYRNIRIDVGKEDTVYEGLYLKLGWNSCDGQEPNQNLLMASPIFLRHDMGMKEGRTKPTCWIRIWKREKRTEK